MMRYIFKKLLSKTGESLVESVASILVFTMSSIILLSMIATATKTNYATKIADENLSAELFIAEAQDASIEGTVEKSDATITVKFKNDIITPYTVNVTSYSSGANTLYSYTGN